MTTPDIQLEDRPDRVVVRFQDREVHTDALREVSLELRERVEQGVSTLVFAMDRVEFFPSACLALLLMLHQDAKRHGARIVLLNCQNNIAFLMKLARLDMLFDLAEGDAADV